MANFARRNNEQGHLQALYKIINASFYWNIPNLNRYPLKTAIWLESGSKFLQRIQVQFRRMKTVCAGRPE